jgi:hypothetical protein
LCVLIGAFLFHVAWQSLTPAPSARASALPAPPPVAWLRAASLGDPIPLAQMLTLYLQAFDNQPGISVPFAELDYGIVIAWLSALLELDPAGQYPLMMASHVYAQVSDENKRRMMLEFVHRQFLRDPERRWRWLAHAALIAKHRLGDMPLALRYAEDIARHAKSAPGWARQMRIFILEDMGEGEAAAVLLGGLLESGELRDANEIRFLTQRLDSIKSGKESSPATRVR